MGKGTWWIVGILVAAGCAVLFLSFSANKPAGDQGVVLNDLFHPAPAVQPVPKKRDPVPPMSVVISPVNGEEAGFSIQVYSFQDKVRAAAALEGLKTNGYKAFMVVSDLGSKGTWYRVRVGGISDEASAHRMLEEIRKAYNSGFIVTPLTNK